MFPGSHSFLLKWPLFLLIKLFGASPTTFIAFTVGVALITVAALGLIIYKIERRGLVFGTICLSLASVLLLVPAQPYGGAILPVNMAMLPTRNLEYVLYIASLVLFVRTPRMRSWRFWLAVGCMSLLIASDKLFLVLSVGGALAALIVYSIARNRNLVSLSLHWLKSSALAGIAASVVLWALNVSHFTHITNQASSSYGLVHSSHDFLQGVIYAFLGLLTNFGDYPVHGVRTSLQSVPHKAIVSLLHVGGVTFFINGVILAVGIFMVWQLIHASFIPPKNKKLVLDKSTGLSIMLVWSTLAAFVSFIISKHEYRVDARYLTIALVAVFISVAAYTSKKKWRSEVVVLAGLIIMIGIPFGILTSLRFYNTDKLALATINKRNSLVAEVVAQHSVDVLVGDYWRVIPTKLISRNKLQVMPLADCTTARDVLSSKSWQPDLQNHSFAYLLSLDKGLTDYPVCTLNQVTNTYGRPNASFVIEGNSDKPKELLLFYDHGANKSSTNVDPPLQAPSLPATPASVVPISLDKLPGTTCTGSTVMNIVAHEDDDLLFMNPDLVHDIQAGNCVRTIYVTAGDAGNAIFYWLSREQGSEAAYDYSDGPKQDIWINSIVKLANNEFIIVANPRGNSKISLIFMHLPDGGISGRGYKTSRNESLERLEKGKISMIQSVDGLSSYTNIQLIDALASLISTYHPTEIRTQAKYNWSRQYQDHSDHMAVGRYVQQAYDKYKTQQSENHIAIPITFYVGYPIRQWSENISDGDLLLKEMMFLEYAKFDKGVCQTSVQCLHNPTYHSYLTRQYQKLN